MALLVVQVVTVVLVAAGIADGAAPQGSSGTINFRYPNFIVDPLVKCPSNGVFPHPHDCTWYYRCHDAYGFGIYRRWYFQCEPGTFFSDKLDQCVFRGENEDCLKQSPVPVSSCRDIYYECSSAELCLPNLIGMSYMWRIEVCQRAITQCPNEAPKDKCKGNDIIFDKTNNRCVPAKSLCPADVPRPRARDTLCEVKVSSCEDVAACRPGQDRRLYRLCDFDRICYKRDGSTSIQKMCVDSVYDAYSNKCVARVGARDRCSTTTAKELRGCSTVREQCRTSKSCETGEEVLTCDAYFACSTPRRLEICEPGFVFVDSLGKCAPAIGGRQNPAIPQVTAAPSNCMSTGSFSRYPYSDYPRVLTQYPFTCSYYGQRPPTPNTAPELKCRDVKNCDKLGNPAKAISACENFFECRYDFARNRHSLYRISCSKGTFFHQPSGGCTDLAGLGRQQCPVPPPGGTLNNQVALDIVISCNTIGEIPELPKNAQRIYCNKGPLCDDFGNYQGMQNVCSTYFTCIKDSSNKLEPKETSCDEPKQYSIKDNSCIIPKTNFCARF